MDFFETVKKRRSIRRFTDTKVPHEVIQKSLEAALLAPNSSNAQTWNFYWVSSDVKKRQLVHACLDQSAARMSSDLIVAVASPEDWSRSQAELVAFVKSINAPKGVIAYYEKLLPMMYRWGFLNSIGWLKRIALFFTGFFRAVPRGPNLLSEIQTTCIKSAALACENFVLAVCAQGYASCMMEGFDEVRVKKLLNLKRSERVVMVIAVGEEAEKGTWGPQFRIDLKKVIHEV
jgi:nitroreductase